MELENLERYIDKKIPIIKLIRILYKRFLKNNLFVSFALMMPTIATISSLLFTFFNYQNKENGGYVYTIVSTYFIFFSLALFIRTMYILSIYNFRKRKYKTYYSLEKAIKSVLSLLFITTLFFQIMHYLESPETFLRDYLSIFSYFYVITFISIYTTGGIKKLFNRLKNTYSDSAKASALNYLLISFIGLLAAVVSLVIAFLR